MDLRVCECSMDLSSSEEGAEEGGSDIAVGCFDGRIIELVTTCHEEQLLGTRPNRRDVVNRKENTVERVVIIPIDGLIDT